MKKIFVTMMMVVMMMAMVGCGSKNEDLRRPTEKVTVVTPAETNPTTDTEVEVEEVVEEKVKIAEGTQEDGTWIYKILAYEVDDVCLTITYNHVTSGEVTKSFALDGRVHCDISNIKVGDYAHWDCPDLTHDELMEIISVVE